MVEAIIQLGRSFGIEVLAEGVESADQEALLIKAGCMEGQGYYYGKPMAERDFAVLLQSWPEKPGEYQQLWTSL